jgi:SAM-dependent methyltransferase
VWGASSSADYILRILDERTEWFRDMSGMQVTDVGAGDGRLGLTARSRGAYVIMTDINPAAIEQARINGALNGFTEGEDFVVLFSNVFENLDPANKQDAIISNAPMQPVMPGAHPDNIAAKSNESGENGRGVIDELIEKARNFLKPGGRLVFTSSSRQGFETTIEDLNKYWGKGNWRILNYEVLDDGEMIPGVEEPIDAEYHGPYMPYWRAQQNMDGVFRVYQKDKNGKPFAKISGQHGREAILTTISTEQGDKTLKLGLKDGKVLSSVIMEHGYETVYILPENYKIPEVDKDQGWYFRYYIIEAINVEDVEELATTIEGV